VNTDIYVLSAKAMIGEDLTDDEKKTLSEYNAKYKLVRYLVMEHRKMQGFELVDFHFTPGDEFLKTSALDVANSIVESFSLLGTPIEFNDSNAVMDEDGKPIRGVFGNPPHTGKVKRVLGVD